MRALLVGVGILLADGPAQAASPAVTFELLDAEPVSIRVAVLKIGLAITKGSTYPCAFAVPIFEGLLENGKPLSVSTDGYLLCISQTRAPLTKVDFGAPTSVVHFAGTPPLRLLVHSRPGPDGALPTPKFWMAPLVLSNSGSEAIGVRVAVGTTGPCGSSNNTPLFSGVLTADVPRTFETDAACICFEQTFAPFLSTGWTAATIRCRPMNCIGKFCQMNLQATFMLSLPSAPP